MASGTPSPRPSATALPPPSPPSIPSSSPSLHSKPAHFGSPRCGPSTPVPSWKLYDNPFYENLAAAAATLRNAASNSIQHNRPLTVSARKLAASLWELQETPLSSRVPHRHSSPHILFEKSVCSAAVPRIMSTETSPCSHLEQRPSPASMPDSPQTIQCNSISPAFKQTNVLKKSPQATPMSNGSLQKKEITMMHSYPNENDLIETDDTSSPLEIDAMKRAVAPVDNVKLGESGIVSSANGLLAVLNRLRSLEDQQSNSVSLVTALRMELEHAHARVQELEFAQTSAQKEIDNLLRRVAEERIVMHTKEQEKVKVVMQFLREEIEKERKTRRKLETLNRRLARDITESNKALAKAVDEVERERKARELMEDVCDELAEEIGRDKAVVEQLKMEHAKVREEVDEERKMLQMTEVWREERVQMKLAQARLELEQKNLALDKLKNKLEVFLNTHRTYIDDFIQKDDIRKVDMLRDVVQETPFQKSEPAWASLAGKKHSVELSGCISSRAVINNRENGELNYNGSDTNRRYVSERFLTARSDGSTALGFNLLRESKVDEGSCAGDESQVGAGSKIDGDSEWEYARESTTGEGDPSDCSADCDEDGDGQEESSPWNSSTELEDDKDNADISSNFSEGCDCGVNEIQMRDDGRYSQDDCRMGSDMGESFKIVPNKEGKFAKDFQSAEIRSAAATSSLTQIPSNGSGNPGLESKQGFPNAGNVPARVMEGLLDGPKGYKSNSLKAKLLEARMESQNARAKHLFKFRFKK